MPSSSLSRSCDSLACPVFLRTGFSAHDVLPAILFPLLSLGFVVVVTVSFLAPLMFSSVTGACSFPFVWRLMAGLRCCTSHGGIISIWLPIVEAPGYSRHSTSSLATQLLTSGYRYPSFEQLGADAQMTSSLATFFCYFMKWRKVFYLHVILPDWVNDNIKRGLTEAVDKYEKQEEEEGKSGSQTKPNWSLSRSPLHFVSLYKTRNS